MASALILLPFYIAYLPTAVYGSLSLCLAFSIFVQIVVTYGFDTSLYIHYHELKHDREKLSALISSVFLFMLACGASVALVFLVAGGPVFSLVFRDDAISFFPYGMASVGIGVFQAIFRVKANLLQTSGQPNLYLRVHIISFLIIAVATVSGLLLYPGSLLGPLGGRLLAAFLAAGWTLHHTFRKFGVHVTSPWKFTSPQFNAYTFGYQLQQWAVNYLDRFIILFFLPLSTVGVYDFAVKCVAPIELVLIGLQASVNPRVVSIITDQPVKKSTPELNRYFYGITAIILIMVCLVIFGIPFVLDLIVAKSEYASATVLIPFVAVIYIFRSIRVYFVVPLTVLKKMRRLTILNFGTTVLRVALIIALIHYWGLQGVIFSAYFALATEMILLWHSLSRYYDIRFNFMKLVGVPLLLLITIVAGEQFLPTYWSTLWHLMYAVLCGALLTLAYRNEIRHLGAMNIFK